MTINNNNTKQKQQQQQQQTLRPEVSAAIQPAAEGAAKQNRAGCALPCFQIIAWLVVG
jgi:hypothetical protein